MVIESVDAAVVTIALMTVEYAYIEDINPTASDSPAVKANNSGHFNGDCRIFSDPKVIPPSRQSRIINNTNEDKYDEGYDSDGERGPFNDAIANQPEINIEDEDNELPNSMLGNDNVGLDEQNEPVTLVNKGRNASKRKSTMYKRSDFDYGDSDSSEDEEPPQLLNTKQNNKKRSKASDMCPASDSSDDEEEGGEDEDNDELEDNDNVAAAGKSNDWFMSKEEIESLKVGTVGVDGLKYEIGRRGLVPTGKKANLKQMLQDCIDKEMPILDGPVHNMNALSGFPVGSKWVELSPSSTDIPVEPANDFAMRAPTDDPDQEPLFTKQNFDEEWDRPVFRGRDNEQNVRLKGQPRAEFIRECNLNVNSHPVEWVDAFLPVYDNQSKKSKVPYSLSIEKMCRWSNEKAALMQMGTRSLYPSFTPFTTQEFEQYLYLFFLNGLNPSPQVQWKLKTEKQDPINSSAFLRRVLGPNAVRRLKEWKCCFACQDPKLAIPSRKTNPNFKVDEFLRHLQIIFRYAWMPGRDLSGDEITFGFQGKHADKMRITFKKAGDGFQCDALADDGYVFTFFMRNQPAPREYLDKGFSPLHSRCFALFDCLMEDYHRVRFDNLYMSAKFALASFQHPKKVMVEGVTRTNQRGLPKEVIQHEIKSSNKKEIAKVKGTVKVAVLENCAPLQNCPLVAASVYDNKGVHILTTCAEKINWMEKWRRVWDPATNSYHDGRFLRLSVIDSYNNNMNNVDVADQLRTNYSPDGWMRNYKWWWALYFGGHGILLTNVYVTHKRFMEKHGYKLMTHYEWRKAVCLAKICPAEYGAPKQKRSIAFQRGDHRATARQPSSRSAADDDSTSTSRKLYNSSAATYASASIVQSSHSGFSARRLDTANFTHFPLPVVKGPTGGVACQLCRWATGDKYSAQISRCEDCNVYLCVWCYKPFHKVSNLNVTFKKKLCAEIRVRKGPKRKMPPKKNNKKKSKTSKK